MKVNTLGQYSNIGEHLTIKNTPAVHFCLLINLFSTYRQRKSKIHRSNKEKRGGRRRVNAEAMQRCIWRIAPGKEYAVLRSAFCVRRSQFSVLRCQRSWRNKNRITIPLVSKGIGL